MVLKHDSRTVQVLRMIRIIHSVEGIMSQMCSDAFRASEYQTDTVRVIREAQVKLQ
jgi:hypothetical protein